MKLGIGRIVAQPAHGLAQPSELAPGDVLDTNRLVDDRRRLNTGLDPVEQCEIALALEGLDEQLAVAFAFGFEEREQAPERPLLASLEPRGVVTEVLDEDVEVADRAEGAAEPGELRAERLCPLGVEHGPGRAQKRPEAARRDTHLVELLGIGAEAGAWVVREDLAVLLLEHRRQVLGGREHPEPVTRRATEAGDRAPGTASADCPSRARRPL